MNECQSVKEGEEGNNDHPAAAVAAGWSKSI